MGSFPRSWGSSLNDAAPACERKSNHSDCHDGSRKEMWLTLMHSHKDKQANLIKEIDVSVKTACYSIPVSRTYWKTDIHSDWLKASGTSAKERLLESNPPYLLSLLVCKVAVTASKLRDSRQFSKCRISRLFVRSLRVHVGFTLITQVLVFRLCLKSRPFCLS